MCLPCNKCNLCGRFPPEGICAYCGFLNEKGSKRCENCGMPFPPPPGTSSKAQQEDASENAAR